MKKYRIVERRFSCLVDSLWYVESKGFLWFWYRVQVWDDDAGDCGISKDRFFSGLDSAREYIREQREQERMASQSAKLPPAKWITTIHQP